MKFRLALPALFALSLALTVSATPAQAAFVSYNTTLTTSSPTFNRPLAGNPPSGLSAVGTSVFYGVQSFFVTTADTYTLETTAATLTSSPSNDTFLALYQTSFNPLSPLTNALQADDDGAQTGVGLSRITRSLSVGVQYFLVSTTFDNGITGSITTRIGTTAGGTPTLGTLSAVPEPSSLVLCGIAGVAGLGYARNRRRPA